MRQKKVVRVLILVMMVCMALSMCVHAEKTSLTVRVTKKAKTVKKTYRVGDNVQLIVKAGSKTVASKKVKFKTGKKKIATVSKKGLIKIKKQGTVTITAKVKKKSVKIKITAKNRTNKTNTDTNNNTNNNPYIPPAPNNTGNTNTGNQNTTQTVIPLASVIWKDTNATTAPMQDLQVGKSIQLSVEPRPTNTTVPKTVTWYSSNTNVATVSNGTVTAKSVGVVTISAMINGYSIGRQFNCIGDFTIYSYNNNRTIQLEKRVGNIDKNKFQIVLNNNKCQRLYPNGYNQNDIICYYKSRTINLTSYTHWADEVIFPNWQNMIATCKWYCINNSMTIEIYNICKTNWSVPIQIYYDGKLIYSNTVSYNGSLGSGNTTDAYYWRQKTNEIKQSAYALYPHNTTSEKIEAVQKYYNEVFIPQYGYNCVTFAELMVTALRDEGYYAGFVYADCSNLTNWSTFDYVGFQHEWVRYYNPNTGQIGTMG